MGLLAFRGYGNGFSTRPTEPVAAAVTDLNRAGRAELEQVPGIGPTLAKAIDEHRTRKGPFKSVEELRQVKGVGPATLEKVRPFLRVDPFELTSANPLPGESDSSPEPLVLERKPATVPPAPGKTSGGGKKIQAGDAPIEVNAASVDDLMRLPGIGKEMAQRMIAARTERPFRTLDDLKRVKGIGPKTLEKLAPFVVMK